MLAYGVVEREALAAVALLEVGTGLLQRSFT
jgi:hypothetical protein